MFEENILDDFDDRFLDEEELNIPLTSTDENATETNN